MNWPAPLSTSSRKPQRMTRKRQEAKAAVAVKLNRAHTGGDRSGDGAVGVPGVRYRVTECALGFNPLPYTGLFFKLGCLWLAVPQPRGLVRADFNGLLFLWLCTLKKKRGGEEQKKAEPEIPRALGRGCRERAGCFKRITRSLPGDRDP